MDRKIYLSKMPLAEAQEIFWKAACKRELSSEEILPPLQRENNGGTCFCTAFSPHYHAAAMDGVAVKSSHTFGAAATSR